MLDAPGSAATPHVTRREDYKPPEWLVPDVALDFALGAERTVVRARLDVVRNGEHSAPLRLNASGLHILDVRLDGEKINYWFENEVRGSTNPAACSAPSARPRASGGSPPSPTGPTCSPATGSG